jgi:soluble lytic murein transglycosylase-like protein
MISRQKLAFLWLTPALALAASPQDDARAAMERSVARQQAAVAAMRISVARQQAAVARQAPGTAESAPDASTAPFFALSWPATSAACDPLPESELAPLVQQAARKEGLDENLLRAVAEEESGFRPCAVSSKGALGLMQLMPATARELGVQDPFDPQENLFSGARFLKQLLTRFGGDAALALGAYNAGAGRVEESGGVPEIPETVRYVQEILSRLPLP